MDKQCDTAMEEKKRAALLAARQLSALLLNFSGDPAGIEDHLDDRKEAMFVLMSDLSLQVEAALVEALNV